MHRKKKKKPVPPTEKSLFHGELEGFDIKVNAFGEMESTIDMDKLNAFLNQRLRDKKLPDADPGQPEKK